MRLGSNHSQKLPVLGDLGSFCWIQFQERFYRNSRAIRYVELLLRKNAAMFLLPLLVVPSVLIPTKKRVIDQERGSFVGNDIH